MSPSKRRSASASNLQDSPQNKSKDTTLLEHRHIEKIRSSISRKAIVLQKEHEETQSKMFQGAKGIEGLKRFLEDRWGSVTAGWLKVFEAPPFDQDGLGRVSFQQFSRACCKIKYGGNIKHLWEDVSHGQRTDSCATVTLFDIDRDAGELLSTFRSLLLDQFGSMLFAWRGGLDVDGRFTVTLQEFIERCKGLGFKQEDQGDVNASNEFYATKLFRNLQPNGPYLRLEDIDHRAAEALYRGDKSMLMSDSWKRGTLLFDESTGSSIHPSMKAQVSTQLSNSQDSQTTIAPGSIPYSLREDFGERSGQPASLPLSLPVASDFAYDEFRRFLVSKFGSVVIAWHCHLDNEGKGQVSFGHLNGFLKRMAYRGNVRALWKKLDPHETGFVTAAALDPGIVEVDTFKESLCKKYGNLLTAWKKVFDFDDACRLYGGLDKATFTQRCGKVDWSQGAEELWHTLLPEPGIFPNPAQQENGRPVPGGVMTLRVFDPPTFQSRLEGNREPDLFLEQAPAVEDFRQMLTRKYGSVLNGWRYALNPKNKDRLAFGEFCAACRRFGYTGSVKSLWKELGCDVTGQITLEHLDSEASSDIAQFHERLCRKYGDLLSAWQRGLDPSGTGKCSDQDFLRVCQEVRYKGDPAQLLKLLRPNKGPRGTTMGSITFACLDPAADIERWHGQSERNTQKLTSTHSASTASDALAQSSSELDQPGMMQQSLSTPTLLSSTSKRNSQGPVVDEIGRCLAARCGSVVAAWRHLLDPGGRGAISFGELCYHLRRAGFHGYFRILWANLDPEMRGFCTLASFDVKAAAELTQFRDLLLERFQTLSAAWSEVFDPGRGAYLTDQEFVTRCFHVGIDETRARRLFHWLLPSPFSVGRHHVTQEDLAEVLLLGVPTVERVRIWGFEGYPQSNFKAPPPEGVEPGTRLPLITGPRGLARLPLTTRPREWGRARQAKEEACMRAKEEANRKVKEKAEMKAKYKTVYTLKGFVFEDRGALRLEKEQAERKAKEEADNLAKKEAKRQAKEEADRLAKEEAERKAKEEAEEEAAAKAKAEEEAASAKAAKEKAAEAKAVEKDVRSFLFNDMKAEATKAKAAEEEEKSANLQKDVRSFLFNDIKAEATKAKAAEEEAARPKVEEEAAGKAETPKTEEEEQKNEDEANAELEAKQKKEEEEAALKIQSKHRQKEAKKTVEAKREAKQKEVEEQKKQAEDEKQLEEAKVEENPVEEKPVEEAKVEEKSVEEKPVEEAKVEEKAVEENPVEEPKVEEKPTEEKQVEEPKAEEKAVEEKPSEEAKDEEKAVEEKQVEEPKVEEKAVEEEAKVEEKPAEEKQVEQAKVEEKPVEEKPMEEAKVEEKAVEEKPVEEPEG